MKHPKLGQHFLNDTEIINLIIDQAKLLKSKNIIEIGPGAGALTSKLIDISKEYIGIELDVNLFNKFCDKYENESLINFINEDAGKFNFDRNLFADKDSYIVVGNLPYYAANLIIRNLLVSKNKPSEMLVMIQKEVADTILLNPPKMKFLSHAIKVYSEAEKIIDVNKGSFMPAPKVTSSIIKLKIFTDNKFEIDREEFIRFIKKGFSNPRKTLINSLYLSKFGSKKEIKDVIKSLKLDINIRPGQINDSLWLKLYKIFEEKNED